MKAKTLIAVLAQETDRLLDHIQPTDAPPIPAKPSPVKKAKRSQRSLVLNPVIQH